MKWAAAGDSRPKLIVTPFVVNSMTRVVVNRERTTRVVTARID
jgi:hypothetical protein